MHGVRKRNTHDAPSTRLKRPETERSRKCLDLIAFKVEFVKYEHINQLIIIEIVSFNIFLNEFCKRQQSLKFAYVKQKSGFYMN